MALDKTENANSTELAAALGINDTIVAAKDLARLFNLSTRRIQQLTQDGILQTVNNPKGGKSSRGYELINAIQAYTGYLQIRVNRKMMISGESELKQQKLKAEVALKESQGELHRLKTDIAAGKYISLEEAEVDYGRFFIIFKRFALSIPSRISGRVSFYLDDPMVARKMEAEMNDEIIDMLRGFVVSGISPSESELKKKHRRKIKEKADSTDEDQKV